MDSMDNDLEEMTREEEIEDDAEYGYFDDLEWYEEEEENSVENFEVVIDEVLGDNKFDVVYRVSSLRRDVENLYELAVNGIPEAENIDIQWGMNADIYFKKEKLLNFVEKYYPGIAAELSKELEDGKLYCVCSVDLS